MTSATRLRILSAMKLETISEALALSVEPAAQENLRQELVLRLEKLPMLAGTKRGPARFLSQLLERIDAQDINSCWNWNRGVNDEKHNGIGSYGVVWYGGKRKAHRLMKELIHGAPPSKDLYACHKCNNPRCCNPLHIYWGTAKQNVQDCKNSGRLVREIGQERYNAKLTEEMVIRIINEAPTRTYGWGRRIAEELGVGRTAINNIIRGRRWKHLTNGNVL